MLKTLFITALAGVLISNAVFAEDSDSTKEHMERAEQHDKAGDRARDRGEHGRAVREYAERNRERDAAVDKMIEKQNGGGN